MHGLQLHSFDVNWLVLKKWFARTFAFSGYHCDSYIYQFVKNLFFNSLCVFEFI